MDLSYITFLLFAAFSSLRMFSYLPQIYSVATDKNGATAISYSTWGLWIGANATTALYAINNLNDVYLASVSVVYAACCVSVIILTVVKRRRHRGRGPRDEAATLRPARRLQPDWLGPRWGVALAAAAVIVVGFGARWVLPEVSRLLPATAAAEQVSEIAVADTPFEDEMLPVSTKTAATAAPDREARQLPLTKTQFEAKLAPRSKRGVGP